MPSSNYSDLPEAESDVFDYNQLNELGDRAIALGLIIGHGHHQGQYELLQRGKVILFTPQEAFAYLKSLIQSAEQGDG